MKKRLIIAGALAGYLVIEAFVFLLYSRVGFNGVEQAVLVSTLGLVAALFYGNRPSPTKALTIVCVVIGFLPVWSGPVALVAYFFYVYGPPETDLASAIGIFVVLLGWIAILIVVAKVSRKLHRRRIPGEADHWLAERAKYRDELALWKQRRRMQKLALCLPSVLVVLMLFFWTPVTGLLYRVSHPGYRNIGPYRVHIPGSWAVYYTSDGEWGRYVDAWKLRGMARAAIFWKPKPPSISAMSFRTAGTHLESDYAQRPIRSNSHPTKRALRFGDMSATCWEYSPESPVAAGVWRVDCLVTAAGHNEAVRSFFNGTKADIPVFYDTLSRIRFKD